MIEQKKADKSEYRIMTTSGRDIVEEIIKNEGKEKERDIYKKKGGARMRERKRRREREKRKLKLLVVQIGKRTKGRNVNVCN